jgi:DNA-binding Lrp family transcriptional regulator
MVVGFVLVKAAPGQQHEVYNRLSKLSEIVELYPLSGEYALITKIKTEDFKKLGEMIASKIRSVKDVVDTKTLIPIAG